MIRLVRVILSAVPGPFVKGVTAALRSFSGFVSGVMSGAAMLGMVMTGLNATVQLVTGAFRALGNAVRWASNTFLDGAIAQERNRVAIESLVQDADLAGRIMGDLREDILHYGMDARQAEFATVQLSMALRGMYGEVDPGKLSELQDMMMQITTIRPDIIGGAQAVGRGLAAALGGDFTTLTRLLDLPLRQIQGLSAETQALLNGAEQASEQRLGVVTRLGAETTQASGDYIKALREILNAAGITEDLVERMRDTVSGQLAILRANWQVFTDDVGNAFLPHLNTALERFIDTIEEHRPEIDAFAASLGEWAGMNFDRLIDFLFEQDWEAITANVKDLGEKGFATLKNVIEEVRDLPWDEITTAVGNVIEAIGSLNDGGIEDLGESASKFNWKDIADAMETVAGAINFIADAIERLDQFGDSSTGQWLNKTFGEGGPWSTPGDFSTRQNEIEMPKWVQDVSDFFGGAAAGDRGRRGPAGASTGPVLGQAWAGEPGSPAANVHITLGFDNDGVPIVRDIAQQEATRIANQTVGGFAQSITRRKR